MEIFEIQFLEKFKPFYFLHYAETNLSSSLILMTHINRGDSRIFNSQRVRERVKKFQLETSAEEFSDLHSTTCQTAHDLSLSRLKNCVGVINMVRRRDLPKSFHIKNLSVSSLWIISIRGNLPNIN